MAYITKSNSMRIIRSIDFKKIGNLSGEVYIKPIYFFSDFENNNLLGLKEFLKDPENFITNFYVPIEVKDNYRFVFEGNSPAYHEKPDCERLNSKYKNFEIPESIREKGKTEIDKFRKWFKENKDLIEKPEIFAARIHMNFGVNINPKTIERDNSGIEIKENLDLEQLESRINNIIHLAGQYYNNADEAKKEVIRKFQKLTFLAYSDKALYNNQTKYSDNAIKKFLAQYDSHFKRPIMDLLIEYYRVKHNPELKFEGKLLNQLGFKACVACHDNINLYDDEESIESESDSENINDDPELPF